MFAEEKRRACLLVAPVDAWYGGATRAMAPSAALALLPTHRADGTRRRAILSQGHTLPLASLPTCVPACLLTTCMHAISIAHTRTCTMQSHMHMHMRMHHI